MSYPDRELIERYQSGDETAFSDLVRKHMNPTHRFVYALVHDEDGACDVVQETFVKVWKHIDSFQQDKLFVPWLLQIAKRTAFDYLRKKKEVSFSEFEHQVGMAIEEMYDDGSESMYAQHDRAQLQEDLRIAVQEMSPLYREALRYRSDGRTFADIANLTKEPLNTVKSRYRRAVFFLIAALETHQK